MQPNLFDQPKRKVAGIFRKAAKILDEQPVLAKCTYQDYEGNLCMVGAIKKAENPDWNMVDKRDGMVLPLTNYPQFIRDFLDDKNHSSLESLNNDSATTKESAASTLRQIARALEHGGEF